MRKNRKPGTFWFIGGLLLIAAAFSLVGYNLWDESRASRSAEEMAEQLLYAIEEENSSQQEELDSKEEETLSPEEKIPIYVQNPDMEMPVRIVDGKELIGILEIPAYEKVLPVISAWSYEDLRQAPCRYAGSAYKGNLVIAAHNYASHFNCLQDLLPGDEIRFTDAEGNVFVYYVALTETLPPAAVEEMTAGEYDLTLFTCTLEGWSRVTVRCEKKI